MTLCAYDLADGVVTITMDDGKANAPATTASGPPATSASTPTRSPSG